MHGERGGCPAGPARQPVTGISPQHQQALLWQLEAGDRCIQILCQTREITNRCRRLLCTIGCLRSQLLNSTHGGRQLGSRVGLFLRLTGKRVFISQDGIDWKRKKWPWFGKLYLLFSMFITAYLPTNVIFDNVFAKEYFDNAELLEWFLRIIGEDPPKTRDLLAGGDSRKYCLICGNRFEPRNSMQLTCCNECGKVHKNRIKREQRKLAQKKVTEL